MCINRNANDAAGNIAFELLAGGKKTGVRAAETHREAKPLVGTYNYIGSPFTRRGEQSKAHQVGCYGYHNAVFMSFGNK
ncbi:hypothetical protein DSECCO2_433570 [anaerobic digester metagenome]